MAENSKIEWCTHTFNPFIGCTKVSPACDNCYAEAWGKRFGVKWGSGQERRRTSASNWKQPLRWNRRAERLFVAWEKFKETNPGLTDEQLIARGFIKPRRPRVFCASLADVFDNEVPPEWRVDIIRLIADTPYLNWLLLTKRIGNAAAMMNDAISTATKGFYGWGSGNGYKRFPNIWLGATVCNQEDADRDIPKLLSTPAAVRFISVEPMLGPVDLFRAVPCKRTMSECHARGLFPVCNPLPSKCKLSGIDWVICGGESGPNARPLHPAWAQSLRNHCAAAGVPFNFKQWGEWVPRSDCYHTFADGKSCADLDPSATKWPCVRLPFEGANGHLLHEESTGDDVYVQRVGKKATGRLLDGVLHDEYPGD